MDHLRQSVNLRGYAQKNPVQEYKRESFSMFTLLLETINIEMVKALCSVSIAEKQRPIEKGVSGEKTQTERPESQQAKAAPEPINVALPKRAKKIGRNELCPCGSGKKYKHCHG